MSDTWIDTSEQLEHALHYWKNYTFSDSYTKLQDAVDSLKGSDIFVALRQVYASRWMISSKEGKGVKEAIFHTVGIYRWGTDDETGNFVLPGQFSESGVPESRIQTEPSALCQFSYGFDTHHDKTLWIAQKAFEDYATSMPNFNRAGKKRRAWQDGTGADKPNSMFVMNAQVFLKRNQATKHRETQISYPLHPWIRAVTIDTPKSEYFANPDRPTLLEPSAGELCRVKECTPPYMKKGDLVWVSFSVQFIIGSDSWSTTFVPYEIVRVGRVAPELVGDFERSTVVVDDTAPRGRLQAGMKIQMPEDFPMHADNIRAPVTDSSTRSSGGTSLQTAPESPNVIQFGPEDGRKYGWEQSIRRSASPVYWSPSPQAEVVSTQETHAVKAPSLRSTPELEYAALPLEDKTSSTRPSEYPTDPGSLSLWPAALASHVAPLDLITPSLAKVPHPAIPSTSVLPPLSLALPSIPDLTHMSATLVPFEPSIAVPPATVSLPRRSPPVSPTIAAGLITEGLSVTTGFPSSVVLATSQSDSAPPPASPSTRHTIKLPPKVKTENSRTSARVSRKRAVEELAANSDGNPERRSSARVARRRKA